MNTRSTNDTMLSQIDMAIDSTMAQLRYLKLARKYADRAGDDQKLSRVMDALESSGAYCDLAQDEIHEAKIRTM